MKRLIICLCLLYLSGCSWDDWARADHWLDQRIKVRQPTSDGPWCEKRMNEDPIANPYMTPID